MIDSIFKNDDLWFVVPEVVKTPDVKQMLHSEKLDFTRFYECKNSQKERFIHDSASGEASFAPLQLFSRR